ncbi:MAG: PSD1 and planctomycete cytochrome C domain-containing protein [Pirellulaceae bacterium]
MHCIAIILLICLAVGESSEAVDFSKQIAPIFQQHCIRCHSPNSRKGEVSVATFDDLKASEFVIPGDPDGSYLLELVTSRSGEPPAMPKEAEPLSDDEVTLLRQWIEQGAVWPESVVVKEKAKADESWWAYQPLTVCEGSVDDFVRAKLAEKELKLSPPADRRTLIRRLSFDLHGLPPTPEAVEAFVNDPDPQAYENLVDRLLDSPRYGERLAQHWLDIAHYADTHGFERDQRREHAWRYRDYVIAAFNEDKPYDRFLQEQLAGDVLWPDNEQAVTAIGFLAAGPWDFVGQVETKSPELRRAARALDLDDMLTQVMTATMGLTVNCARCHDHKLDPITQREYYQLQAVFAGAKRADRVVSEAALKEHDEQQRALSTRRNEIDFEIGRLRGAGLNLADIVGGGNGLGTGQYRSAIDPRNAKIQTRDFGKLGNVVLNRFSPSDLPFVDGVFIPDGENGQREMQVSSTGITISGLPKTSGDAWDMIRNGPVASQHSTELGGVDFTKESHSLLGLHANAGITFDIAAMRRSLIGHNNASTADNDASDSQQPQPTLRFTSQLGYFGAIGGHYADAWVFIDGKQAASYQQLRREDGLKSIDIELPSSCRFLTLISTDGGNGYSMDQICFGDPHVKLAILPETSEEDRQRLAELERQRSEVEAQIQSLGPPPKFYGIVAEPTVSETRLLTRGNPETPTGDLLGPAALGAISMLDRELGTPQSNDGERRAALARWITHPDNPLTPRVIVNRLWHWHFGKGLVETPSDFGFGGGGPSHPELLDWLAAELVRREWSLKEMHRLILHSQTYRQSSRFQDETSATLAQRFDADNDLLWRQNARRIEAEAIRDAVLSVSGKLNDERGGPGFEDFRYQEAYAPIYTYVTADEPSLWRRSIYRYKVRTTPSRFLSTLDCPDPANLTPDRLTTTTPLQSLALYNNDFMLRQAQYFAERVMNEAGSQPMERIERAFQLAFARHPTTDEKRLAVDLVRQQGLFALCRALLNANEFVYVD